MFGKWGFSGIGFLIAFLVGCAEPKYVNSNGGNESSPAAQEAKVDCKNSFSKSGVCLSWSWEKKPISNDEGTLIFKTYRLNKFDQTPITVDADSIPKLVLWMPSMGHGSTPTETERLDVGTYRSSHVRFVMPGEWELKFQIKNSAENSTENATEKSTENLDEVVIKINF